MYNPVKSKKVRNSVVPLLRTKKKQNSSFFFFFWYSAVPTAGQWLPSLGRRQSTTKNSGHCCKSSRRWPAAGGSWRQRTAATVARHLWSSHRWESCLGKIAEVVSRCTNNSQKNNQFLLCFGHFCYCPHYHQTYWFFDQCTWLVIQHPYILDQSLGYYITLHYIRFFNVA